MRLLRNEKSRKFVFQIIKFGCVGVLNNIIYLIVYYIVIYIQSELYLLGNVLGFLISTMNAYIFNSKYVFRLSECGKYRYKKTLFKTYVVYAIALCISTLLLYILIDMFTINKSIAPIICLGITVPLNFLLNKLWVYKK